MKSTSPLQTPLARARRLGSAKHGVSHWWLQRVTALALVPMTAWFLAAMIRVAQSPDPFVLADWMASPVHAAVTALMLVAVFWHAKLGAQVVIEDYVKAPFAKYGLLFANTFFCWGLAALGLIAVLKLHLLDIISGF